MTKTVPFRQPSSAAAPKSVEEFVNPGTSLTILPGNEPPLVRMSRMSIDVPKTLHTRFKFQCLRRGKTEKEIGAAIMERGIIELEKE